MTTVRAQSIAAATAMPAVAPGLRLLAEPGVAVAVTVARALSPVVAVPADVEEERTATAVAKGIELPVATIVAMYASSRGGGAPGRSSGPWGREQLRLPLESFPQHLHCPTV